MKFLFILTLFICALAVSAKLQKVEANGILICGKKRIDNVRVQIWDYDMLGWNDLLGEDTTNSEGEFNVKGEEDEIYPISPYLAILNPCRASIKGCYHVTKYPIPQRKIDGDPYKMGYLALDIVMPGEVEVCP